MNVFELINADFATITSAVDIGANDDGTPCGFMIVGADSPQYLAENDRQRNEGLAYQRAAKKDPSLKIDMTTDEGNAKFQERYIANLIAQATAVTVGWYGFNDAEGKEVAFDKKIVAAMFAKKSGWREKVLNAVNEDARFLPKSAQS